MLRKTMMIGKLRTSIKLEVQFWRSLTSIAMERNIRLAVLVNEIASATPERTNLASTLRTFALNHLSDRSDILQAILDMLADMTDNVALRHLIEACPAPLLRIDSERAIVSLNSAFCQAFNLDFEKTRGQRIDKVVKLRDTDSTELWVELFDGNIQQLTFYVRYVHAGGSGVSRATAVRLCPCQTSDPKKASYVIMFKLGN